jgi:hypothetical protein
MGMMFVIVPVIMATVIVIGVVMIAFQATSGIKEWSRNNSLPVEDSAACVVSRRTEIRGGGHSHDHSHSGVSTRYYATFELRSGERKEFGISGPEYGVIVEGDEGTLTHQGTRYKGFHRGAPKSADRDF